MEILFKVIKIKSFLLKKKLVKLRMRMQTFSADLEVKFSISLQIPT